MGDMERLTKAFEAKIAAEMPSKFGLIFDGWSHASDHFLALFGCYEVDGVMQSPLLSLAPVISDPDTNHNAETHKAAIATVLGFFGKTIDQVAFLVSDNYSLKRNSRAS